jgi:hypothetical protein
VSASYRKKPVVIAAVRWIGDNEREVASFARHCFKTIDPPDRGDDPDMTAQVYDTLHATWVLLGTGDWIVRGVKGEFYPVRDDVFRETYEPVDESD